MTVCMQSCPIACSSVCTARRHTNGHRCLRHAATQRAASLPCEHKSSLFVALSLLAVHRARRLQCHAAHTGSITGASGSRFFEDLSEEELLALELEEEDILMNDEEQQEWEQYDQEVQTFRDLMSMAAASPHTSGNRMLGDSFSARFRDQGTFAVGCEEALPTATDIDAVMRRLVTDMSTSSQIDTSAASCESGVMRGIMPANYRKCLEQSEDAVIVSQHLGPKTVVLISRPTEQPQLLPTLMDVIRAEKVNILVGWMATSKGLALDAFEVCSTLSGESLAPDACTRLQEALSRTLRRPDAQQVLDEIQEQVPILDAFFALPVGGLQPPACEEVRQVLSDNCSFEASEAYELGRCLIFRGVCIHGVSTEEVLWQCRRQRLCMGCTCEREWDFLLYAAKKDLLLLMVPAAELERSVQLQMDEVVVFMISVFLTVYALASSDASITSTSTAALLIGSNILAELARRVVAKAYGVRLSMPFLIPSWVLGTFGAASPATSTVPSAAACFDLSAATLTMSFSVSTVLMVIGFCVPPDSSCVWVNPEVLPYSLQQLVYDQADSRWIGCTQPQPTPVYVPASPWLAAGCLSMLSTALNCLPLPGLDGARIAAASEEQLAKEVFLPWAALLLLGSAVLDVRSGDLFSLFLVFMFTTFFVRLRLQPAPVLRDNVSQPWDFQRKGTGFILFLLSFGLLLPARLMATTERQLPWW
eukprot:TRINITY_DN88539_c0_g1_i1.p1 TRINITY_DN88539_c0_g1~~TRINITY_DN88539_c0_g1_i1.p1  ORF type:complete len:704 (-),score=116.38 TRINITY_DN88539_c0_g1_i1:210-2321(-)